MLFLQPQSLLECIDIRLVDLKTDVCFLDPSSRGIHAKDGLWPTNPRQLGEEVPIGKGKVDFPRIIARLKELKYGGAVTIEREISGTRQVEDVRSAKAYLESLIG